MTTEANETTSVSEDVVVAGATAIAEAFGLGDRALPASDFPTDDGDTVLVATLDGADGMSLALAVNDDVAARLMSDPSRLKSGFERALAAIVEVGGAATGATVDQVGPSEAVPNRTAEIQDGSQLCALFGVSLAAPGGAGDVGAAGFDDGGDVGGPAGSHGGVATSFEPAALAADGAAVATPSAGPLTLLEDVEMDVTVELGRTTMPIRELLALQPGMVVEIDRTAGTPIDVLVNGRRIACGEVVVIDEEFGIRITDIVDSRARV